MANSLRKTPQRVITGYDMLDAAVSVGITDFTDGKYNGDDTTSYEVAQEQQANWLLDRIQCNEGKSVLDIGCGYGRILETAEQRGANAKGITISLQQQVLCMKKGLNVSLMNYINIPEKWNNSFDGVIANGSLEHYVQLQDALEGKQDEIYRNLFKIGHRITKPESYFATTAIHFSQEIDPRDMTNGSKAFPPKSDKSHFAKIQENLGGWYPYGNQLEKCAQGLFTLKHREDGTHDYHLTSEYWLQAIKDGVKGKPKVWVA
ncbi:class I SAM-dependent methyltransferase, partial [archaeon]|nr:class I SAM-dependent methyltransferase [archaeon]